ncbi:MAG: hypothetical protein V4677_15415 [Bacteroidota bacterium]
MSFAFDHIEIYFTEERIESLFFIILGSIAIILALLFLGIIKYSFFKGMAIPLLLIGIIQLTVGIIVYNRSAEGMYHVNQMRINERSKLKTEELPRMEKVMKNFMAYKWLEIALLVAGATIFIGFYNSAQSFWKGFGLALMIQAGVMLSLDLVAEQRAKEYVENLTIL